MPIYEIWIWNILSVWTIYHINNVLICFMQDCDFYLISSSNKEFIFFRRYLKFNKQSHASPTNLWTKKNTETERSSGWLLWYWQEKSNLVFNFSSEYQGCQFNGISVPVKEPLSLDGNLRHATPFIYIYTEFRIDVRAWEHNRIHIKQYDVSTHNLHDEFTCRFI